MKQLLNVFLLACMMVSCSTQEDVEVVRRVKFVTAKASSGIHVRTFSGLAKAGDASKLSFKINGTVEYIGFNIGDHVKKGDVLARLDPLDYSLRFEETQASLMQAKAQDRHATAKYARIRELYEMWSTSRNELDASRAESESASAAVAAMQKKLALVRLQLSYTHLLAPTGGIIASIEVEENENVQAGQVILVLNAGKDIEVKVSIPEVLIGQVHRNDEVRVRFDAFPEKLYSGFVKEVGVLSETGNTFSVTVSVKDQISELRSGMSAEVSFDFYKSAFQKVCYLPSTAVMGTQKEQYVITLVPISQTQPLYKVVKRRVIVGKLGSKGLEIISGVNSGDRVVSAGADLLHEGETVKGVESDV